MEVILLEKIRNLGVIGDRVKVKSGYGRNFLVPQGKAVYATNANIAEFEKRRAELEKKEAEVLAQAQQRAATLQELSLTITTNAGDDGKLMTAIDESPRQFVMSRSTRIVGRDKRLMN